ncbi:MAG: hypothetical protein R2739_10495 [Chitinophagales bacterium]|nr:LEA type 2 family protein [Bacteroidota bacterium]
MKNKLNILFLFWSIVVLFAPLKANDDSKKEPYLVKTKDFHVESFSLKEIGLGITAVIYNPYRAKVTIDEILIDVFIGDKKLGTITEAADKVKIKKESAFDLPLGINVKTGPTLSKVITEGTKMVLKGSKIRVDYKGYIKVKALGFIPVKVKINQFEYFTLKDILNATEDKKPTPPQKDSTATKPTK